MATRSGADTLLRERRDLMFPTLTTEQVARIGSHGRRRTVDRAGILIDRGDRVAFFVIASMVKSRFCRATPKR
jgi:hypothetical protein